MSSPAFDTAHRNVLRFGTFELDVAAGELRKSGLRVKVQPQPFRILCLLLQNPGELVTREELSAKLWPAETYVEFDRSLNRAIVKLRDVLGDTADSPRFIETIPKRGYRFVAPVSGDSITPPGPAQSLSVQPQVTRKMPIVAFLAAILALVVAIVAYAAVKRSRKVPVPAIRSIVVLPLENLSKEADQEYFADGITDELITDLAKIHSLRVVSRTTAMHYKGTRQSLPEIAKELGVDAVVEGTVSRSGDTIRIRAQLVRSATDEHVWANSYERALTDAVSLQTQVAHDIADEIEVKLTPREKQALGTLRTLEPKAYEEYLKARYLFNLRTVAADRESIESYRKAIALDPNFAAAYAGLADALALRTYLGEASAPEIMPEARSAIEKALALNSDSVDAHVSAGWMKLGFEWDWDGAGQEIKRALELDPNSSAAHQLLGQYLLATGHIDDAILEHRKALELDPLSPYVNRDLGRALYYARRYDDALKQLQRTLDLEPKFAGVVLPWISWCYEKKDMQREAVQAFLDLQRADGYNESEIRNLQQTYTREGWKQFWVRDLKTRREPPLGATDYFAVLAHARLGDKQNALSMLRREVELHTIWVSWMNIDPELDSIREDPSFQKLLRTTGR